LSRPALVQNVRTERIAILVLPGILSGRNVAEAADEIKTDSISGSGAFAYISEGDIAYRGIAGGS